MLLSLKWYFCLIICNAPATRYCLFQLCYCCWKYSIIFIHCHCARKENIIHTEYIIVSFEICIMYGMSTTAVCLIFKLCSCNRYKERAEVRQRLRQSNTLVMRRKSIEDMIQARKKSMENRAERNNTEDLTEERSRFMHYYNRYQNHLESIKVCV